MTIGIHAANLKAICDAAAKIVQIEDDFATYIEIREMRKELEEFLASHPFHGSYNLMITDNYRH